MWQSFDAKWTGGECSECKQPATAHGWLHNEQRAPTPPARDERKVVGEFFEHDGGTRTCIVGVRHEHDFAKRISEPGRQGYECECGAFQPLGLTAR